MARSRWLALLLVALAVAVAPAGAHARTAECDGRLTHDSRSGECTFESTGGTLSVEGEFIGGPLTQQELVCVPAPVLGGCLAVVSYPTVGNMRLHVTLARTDGETLVDCEVVNHGVGWCERELRTPGTAGTTVVCKASLGTGSDAIMVATASFRCATRGSDPRG